MSTEKKVVWCRHGDKLEAQIKDGRLVTSVTNGRRLNLEDVLLGFVPGVMVGAVAFWMFL